MPGPVRLPAAERRRQIADAALAILATHGARRLTAAALASEVGITDGAIFRHFKNKDEIIEAALDRFEAALESTFPADDGEPLARLRLFVVQRLALVRRQPQLMRLAFNDRLAEAAGEARRDRIGRIVGRSTRFVHECLCAAQASGAIRSTASPTILVWTVVGVIRGAGGDGPLNVPGEPELQHASPEAVWTALETLLQVTSPHRAS
jgi:AcrR family transcriptional regulator